MLRIRLLLLGLATGLIVAAAQGADPPDDVKVVAGRIDKLVAARWTEGKVPTAAVADDAEFLRRAYLDLWGRIPHVSEAREFLEDKSPDKRARLVEKLLGGGRYVTHMTNVYRALFIPESRTNFQIGFATPTFEQWLRQQFAQNAAWDKMVRELLTVPIAGQGGRGGIVLDGGGGNANALPFYQAKEFKPENLAASATRLFLGVRLECAQCHDHPFAKWKKEQFWNVAAFFAGIQRQQNGDFVQATGDRKDKREIAIPGTEKTVPARFLDGEEPTWADQKSARETLAAWITSRDNPYFARATVNRVWASLMGSGLAEPIDEMVGSDETVVSHKELLDDLAREFVNHDFDLKFLIKAIMASKAYQLSSAASKDVPDEVQVFARMPVRGLSGEQLFDSIVTATGYDDRGGNNQPFVIQGNASARAEFLNKFNSSERPSEAQTSILQALTLMNGRVVASATSLNNSELLTATIDAPFLDNRAKIETLFLATLSRYPKPKELDKLVKYVEDGKAPERLADVFWVLLNSGEFFLNH